MADQPISWAAKILVWLVEFYQKGISPLLVPSCRFQPSCSAYAHESLSTWGAWKGTWLTVVRILKCAPWHRGGYDPVPVRSPQVP